MEIKKIYLSRKKSWRLLVVIVSLSFFLNLGNIHTWAQQKSVSKLTMILLKFTDSFNYLGEEVGLNYFSKNLRLAFNTYKSADLFALEKKREIANEVSDEKVQNPLLADVANLKPQDDEVAALQELSQEETHTQQILLMGDSMLKSGLQMHLQSKILKALPESQVTIKSQSGTGLSRPEIFNWIDYVNNLQGLYEDIYIFLGTNDAQNFVVDKKIYAFGSEDWSREYISRVNALIKGACEKAKNVFWVGSLKMRSESFDKKMNLLNTIVKSELKKNNRCGKFIGTAQWITEKNNYVDHMLVDKKTLKVRMEDGIHLSYWGALLFSEKLIEYAEKQKSTN